MAGEHLSEFEVARALKLANKLRDKIVEYFPEPPQEARTAEVNAIRAELEKMGFRVTWNGTLDPNTMQFEATVTLWLPKKEEKETPPPG